MVDPDARPTPPNPRRRVELWRVLEAMRESRPAKPAPPGSRRVQPPPSGQPFWNPSTVPARPAYRRTRSQQP